MSAGSDGSSQRPLALVTGGARRVGAATCRALARAGFDVLLTYNRSEEDALATAERLSHEGVTATAARLGLDDPGAVLAAAQGWAATLPRLDALIHNASVYGPTPLAHVTAEEALRQYRVNALAPLLLTRALAPLLARSPRDGGGSVVAMCDIHVMGRPRPAYSAYAMSKAALVEMVRTLARELAPAVRVNGVAPGVVAWPEEGEESHESAQRAYLSRVPLARSGTPHEAAEAVAWLVTGATYTTGQILRVDGGRWLA